MINQNTKTMINKNSFAYIYAQAVCEGKPFDLPCYNEATEQWQVPFIESPNDHLEELVDLIEIPCESAQEATDIYNHHNHNPVGEEQPCVS